MELRGEGLGATADLPHLQLTLNGAPCDVLRVKEPHVAWYVRVPPGLGDGTANEFVLAVDGRRAARLPYAYLPPRIHAVRVAEEPVGMLGDAGVATVVEVWGAHLGATPAAVTSITLCGVAVPPAALTMPLPHATLRISLPHVTGTLAAALATLRAAMAAPDFDAGALLQVVVGGQSSSRRR